MIIKAADYGIVPNCAAAEKLTSLFHELSNISGEKTLVFENGDYFIDSKSCAEETLYITNTAGDKEYSPDETPHRARVALNLNGVSDLTIDGNGARFVINGAATNASFRNCENVTVSDIEITSVNPDLHELSVVGKGAFYVDFAADKNTRCSFENNKPFFTGEDYKYNPVERYRNAWHLACIKKETPDCVRRVHHVFASALGVKDLKNGKIRVYYPSVKKFDLGDKYYLFPNRRQYVGIFVDSCKNMKFCRVKQRFNYSLAFVAQNTENILIDGAEFAPESVSERKMASLADFIQICMCKGLVTVQNSFFEGAGDDCANVHGIHFKIKEINANKITVAFMHPQTHAFNPIHTGDEISFIDTRTLIEKGKTVAVSSTLINENEIEIELESTEHARIGDVIEDITMCPDFIFRNNTVNRIITRGLLITTRGRVLIEENHFKSCSMSGILLSDDANSWYESGMCRDVTIKNNIFDYCGEFGVLIKPENRVHGGAVHRNIRIIGNTFKQYNGDCISIKSSADIEIKGNDFADSKRLKTENCENVKTDF